MERLGVRPRNDADHDRGRALPILDGAAAGALLAGIPTPALVVEADGLERNLHRMAERMRGPVRLRPHFKTHKSVELARRQIAAGAIGITTATVWEAHALAAAGFEDVLIANQVLGAAKLRRAAEIARGCRLTIAVDSAEGARALSAAATAAGTTVAVLLEIDVGMGRCGVRGVDEALALATLVDGLDGIELHGVMGYEGHCVLERDDELRGRAAGAAIDVLAEAAARLRAAGHRVDVVSAGGTGTTLMTGADERVTDIQAGSYVFMDAAYEQVLGEFEVTLSVLATVISRHDDTAVLDCGVKTVATSLGHPRLAAGGGTVRYVAEEHTVVDLDPGSPLAIGDRVRVVTGHCCETVNLHDRLFLVRDETILEIWQTMGRGPGGAWE
jgi:D-serine deaminase-like pyridoxal phosphate-dependent protein